MLWATLPSQALVSTLSPAPVLVGSIWECSPTRYGAKLNWFNSDQQLFTLTDH